LRISAPGLGQKEQRWKRGEKAILIKLPADQKDPEFGRPPKTFSSGGGLTRRRNLGNLMLM